jgi:serine/threonine-protein kinase HipA
MLRFRAKPARWARLDAARAKIISREVAQSVTTWRKEAPRYGLSKAEIDRMASAFEHHDLRQALGK